MTWLIGVAGIASAVLFISFCVQSHQNKVSNYAEGVRVHIKAQGGQDIQVKRLNAPHLTGAMLFSASYTDVNGRRIMSPVTVHTAGQYEDLQFWGEPVTPAFD